MDLPKEVKRGIKRIAQLDVKEKALMDTVDAIQATSPIGQLPPPFYRALDKAIKISAKKAQIWNDIRNFSIPGIEQDGFRDRTLWQLAVGELAVGKWGEERHLDFGAREIRCLLNKAAAK